MKLGSVFHITDSVLVFAVVATAAATTTTTTPLVVVFSLTYGTVSSCCPLGPFHLLLIRVDKVTKHVTTPSLNPSVHLIR
ncbi:hypothetical protein F5Y03DRAFT_376300 [Xylaria venustula]|nr:hypothetical protein F5Y03DRAFT_376300 [Xylaria venustula]